MIERFRGKMAGVAEEHVGRVHFGELLRERLDLAEAGEHDEREVVWAETLAAYVALGLHRDAQGRTGWLRWAESAWRGLNNDERFLAQAAQHAVVTVIEIQRICGAEAVDCVDLYAETPSIFRVAIPALAQNSVRFDRYIALVIHYPHISDIEAQVTTIPFHCWEYWTRTLTGILNEAQARDSTMTCRRWLLEHFAECGKILLDIYEAQRQAMLRQMDFHHCTARYAFSVDRTSIQAVIESKPDFEPCDPVAEGPFPKPLLMFRWLRRGESRELENRLPETLRHHPNGQGGWGILGTLRLYQDHLILETFRTLFFDFAQRKLASWFGSNLQLTAQAVTDLAQQMADQPPTGSEETDDPADQAEGELEDATVVLQRFRRGNYTGPLTDLFRQHSHFEEDPEPLPPEADDLLGVFFVNFAATATTANDLRPGSVHVRRDEFEVMAVREPAADQIRELVERLFGNAVKFVEKRIVDLAALFEERDQRKAAYREALSEARAESRPLPDPTDYDLQPEVDPDADTALEGSNSPPPEVERELLQRFHQDRYGKMIDEAIPMLEGRSPREAAQDPSLRPRLIEWLKLHINGNEHQRRDRGIDIRLDWMVEELGVSELQ